MLFWLLPYRQVETGVVCTLKNGGFQIVLLRDGPCRSNIKVMNPDLKGSVENNHKELTEKKSGLKAVSWKFYLSLCGF
jgi:hypothetical protein